MQIFAKDRFRSQPRQKSDLAKDVEEIKKDTKEIKTFIYELKKNMANCLNRFVEEEYEVIVRFVNESVQEVCCQLHVWFEGVLYYTEGFAGCIFYVMQIEKRM